MISDGMTRRDFIRQATQAGIVLGGGSWLAGSALNAVTPFARSGPPRLLLSLAGYSFRRYFGKDASQQGMDLFSFVDFCAEHGCDGTELTSYYFDDVSPEFLLKLRRYAFLKGMPISGTAVGNDFTRPKEERKKEIAGVKQWIDRADILGAPHIRIFVGSQGGLTRKEVKRRSIPAIEECAEYAAKKGIFLGVENHGGYVGTADELLEIVRSVKSRWLGVNLDTGNFHTDAPYDDIARSAPYAVNVQLKVHVNPAGKESRPVDIPRIVKILKQAGYQGFVALEYEASKDPWEEIPRWLEALNKAFSAA